ncbi:sensor histidine kinase [Spirosoma sp.]|uniref:sensor histidine kinase n=1 Tax=Spirosoma sp. TaxID=1899569 RepID=UPI002628B9B8|nr:sensor histidine kinase [Spirosoma sp.]MCX6219005.1 histidine kinase [Spirosoma sp.]
MLRWLLLMAFGLQSILTFGQEYPVTRYTNHDGLPQMQILRVFEDSRGYIWIGTRNGFSMFDGEQFKNFRTRDGVGSSYIGGFVEDRKGNVWIASLRGVVRFDGDTLVSFHHERFIDPGTIAIDSHDQLFALTYPDHQLTQLVKSAWQTTRVVPNGWKPTGLISDKRSKQLYISFEKQGLFLLDNGKLTPVAKDLMLLSGVPTPNYTAETNGYSILGGELPDKSRLILYRQGANYVPFLKLRAATVEVLQTVPFDYVYSHKGNIYLLERGSRHSFLLMAGSELLHATSDGISYWIGTRKGLLRVFTNGIRYFSEQTIPAPRAVLERSPGVFWIVNSTGPIQQLQDGNLSRVSGYEQLVKQHDPGFTSHWEESASVLDNRKALWISYGSHMLHHGDGNTFSRIETKTDTDNPVVYLLNGAQRNLVLASRVKQVDFYSIKPPYRVVRSLTEKGGLMPGPYISALEDKRGNYWIGSTGLTHYNFDTKVTRQYPPLSKKLPARGILSMCRDARGTLWLGTGEGGCLYFDQQKDAFIALQTNLLQNIIYNVTPLDATHLLITDSQNIYILDLAIFYATGKVTFQLFTSRNGFLGIEPVEQGVFKDAKGIVWLSTGTGLAQIDPRRLNLSPNPVRTYFTSVNTKRIPFRRRTPDSVAVLAYRQNTLAVGFEAIGVNKPLRTQFSYRIPGISDNWSSWQTNNQVTITNLPPGLHTIELKTQTGDLTESGEAVARLRFRVSLPVWQWPMFPYLAAGIIGLLMVSLGYVYFRSRQSSLRLQQQEQQLLFLQVQTLQAQLNPHFVFNVLGTLQRMILTNDLEQANRGLLRLAQLIRGFLESSVRSEMPKSRSAETEVKLDKELEMLQMYVEFEHLQYRDRFTYAFDVAPTLVTSMWSIPPMLIQPFVENAIKHGLLYKETSGHLSIRIWPEDDDRLCIQIDDDGVGREGARRQQATSIKPYVSRGSGLVKKRIELLNQMGYHISLTTSDRPAGGTLVDLIINYTPKA